MFSSILNRNTRSLARIEITDEQIRRSAPSVFAASPVAGVSDKYTFLPTSQIVDRMRQEGWAPVEVRQQAVRVSHSIVCLMVEKRDGGVLSMVYATQTAG